MKIRILMLSLLGLMFFNSCSSDSNSTSQSSSPGVYLPKTIIRDNLTDYGSYIYDFYYNQNKIDFIKVSYPPNNNTSYFYFTYTGDLITKVENGDLTQHNLYGETNCIYQNGLLIQNTTGINLTIGGTPTTLTDNTTYNYNPDGTGTFTKNGFTGGFTLNNGLLTKYYDTNTQPINIVYSSSFSPFKNILGVKNLFFLEPYETTIGLLEQLFVSTTYNNINYRNFQISYVLNSDLYPTSIIQSGNVNSYSITYY